MGEIIRTWLRARLGVIIDLSPEIFGQYARDGTLLAKLLHSYDIINENQLRTLNRTEDPALSRVNLKSLRIWLRFIDADCDDETTEDISNGKGTAALRLFYKVFLALENKDSLHFITLQKEREKFVPNSSKFDVTTISEDPEPAKPEDHPLAGPLKKGASLIEWQRKRTNDFAEGGERGPENIGAAGGQNEVSKPSSRGKKVVPRRPPSALKEAEKRELDEFAEKHRVEGTKELLDPCEAITEFRTEDVKIPEADYEAAKAYTKSLKLKYRREAMTKSFRSRVQKELMLEFWEKLVSDQERKFDELIARKVLNQSQYEKKMMRKLCDIRNEKSRMAANRQIVEELSQRTKEREVRLDEERAREVLVRESEELEAERKRMNELERRINEEMARKLQRKLRRIGEDIVNDLIDISVKIIEYKIASDDDNVPKSLRNHWKSLFVKSQPIFGAEEDIRPGTGWAELEDEASSVEIDNIDFETADILNYNDFENYHNLRSPWNDFVPEVDSETQEFLNLGPVVLGYLVHKAMRSFQPYAEELVEPPLPKMKVRATVLGIPDSLLHEPMRELLRHRKIHLVLMEDAINFCLGVYKFEMKDCEYIDLNIVAATKQSLTRRSSASAGDQGKKLQKKEKKLAYQPNSGHDKVTQTPRVIPYEDLDPTLSNTAYIGKWAHEFLTLGQPFSDDLNARILLEYLKSLKDIQGFVLVNYPTTYEQMTSLEFALSGRRLPDKLDKFRASGEVSNIEEIDPAPSRITFESEGYELFDSLRKSRLVPDPLEGLEASDGISYFTAFVEIKQMSKSPEKSEIGDCEILPDDGTSLEAFYADQEIASVLYYTMFDLPTLKRLTRVLITGGTSLSGVSSEELFGDAVEYFEGRRNNPSAGAAPVVKKLVSRASACSLGQSGSSEASERSDEAESKVPSSRKSKEDPPRPGEPEWTWANLPQPLQLTQSLASLWRDLENAYIENLKDMFQLKRTHLEAVVPYMNFVRRHMKEYVERPDNKQDLLHEFHRAFNDIDEDIREHVEVKRELYCRIADFEALLWDICNERRKEAEEERRRLIKDHWTTQEAIVLTNVYIGLLQAEIDRCIDTLQFIQDYYLAMLQRPLQDAPQSKILLQRIALEAQSSDSNREFRDSVRKMSTKSLKEKETNETRAKMTSVKITDSPSCAHENRFREEIAKLLTEVESENFDPTQTICYESIEANVRYVQTIVEAMASSALDILKKEEAAASKSPGEPKGKKVSSRKVSQASRADDGSAKKRSQDLVREWRYALMFEIARIRLRLKILDAAARSDIDFLVDGMQRLFFGLHQLLVDGYQSEVKSVNLMASTFRLAIEEAAPIQKEMLLDGDRFLVRSNVLMYADKSQPDLPVREESSTSGFQIAQLGRLLDIFCRVAPCGTLAERSFVYILQDLIACGDEDGETSLLPLTWLQLRACDVPRLVYEIFGDDQLIDWREFVIYALDIEMPSVDQFLDSLDAFRNVDKISTDTVSYEEFHSLRLWFFDWGDTDGAYSSSLLHENFERDEEELREQEKVIAFDSARNKKRRAVKISSNGKSLKPESVMRLTLAKELLCEIFSTKTRRVNYMALLLAFCKDEEPKEGLRKALSLATGTKICSNWEEGEKFVEELRERRRATEASQRRIREQATSTSKAILNVVLKGVLRKSKSGTTEPAATVLSFTQSVKPEAERISIRIEKLDAPGESIDPADLLPHEDSSTTSVLDDAEDDVTQEEIESHTPTVTITLPEDSERRKPPEAAGRELVYWLSIEDCQAVLAAMLPRLVTQPDLFESGKTLRENLQLVCLELRDEELNEDPEQVLAHRFLHHIFVKRVLAGTRKFTTLRLGNLVDKIRREN